MMKARRVHFNHQSGVVTVEPHPAGEKFTVTEDAAELEVTAGDDVSVSVDGMLMHVEALSDEPLLVRTGKREEAVEVLTARRATVEPSAAKP